MAAILVGLWLFLSSSTVFAARYVFEDRDVVVPEKQTVENVVVIGGSATIYGSVRDSVIVFNGNLDIKPSAYINGLVLVVGGKIHQEPGARLNDNVLNINFNQATMNSVFLGGTLLAGIWFMRLALSLLLVILPVFIAFFARDRLGTFGSLIRRSTRKAVMVGFVASFLLAAVSTLLFITVIGIPLSILLVLAAFLAFLIGLTVAGQMVGDWIPGSERRPTWLTVFGGTFLVVAGFNFPLLGGVLFLALFWISLGILILGISEWRKRPRDPEA